MNNKKGSKYGYIGLIIYQSQGKEVRKLKQISEKARNIWIKLKLQKGSYIISTFGTWINAESWKCGLATYGPSGVEISPLSPLNYQSLTLHPDLNELISYWAKKKANYIKNEKFKEIKEIEGILRKFSIKNQIWNLIVYKNISYKVKTIIINFIRLDGLNVCNFFLNI